MMQKRMIDQMKECGHQYTMFVVFACVLLFLLPPRQKMSAGPETSFRYLLQYR